MPNLVLRKKKNPSTFRRIAMGTWKTVGDPSVYGSLSLEADEALRYVERFREKTGKHLTLTHMVGKAVAGVLEKMPDANAIIRFKHIYLRQDIGVFFQVATEDEKTGEFDLSGLTIHSANEKSLEEFVDEFNDHVKKVRANKDKELARTRKSMSKIPFVLMGLVLKLISFFSYTLNLNLRRFGIPKDPFGSVMVTNIGSLGLEQAFVPIVPYSRVPLLIAMGGVREEPIIVEGTVKAAKRMRICATFDHRLLDGSHAAIMARELKAWFDEPFKFFDPIDSADA